MRVVFVDGKKGGINPEKIFLGRDSLVLFGKSAFPAISLDDELRGETNLIKSLCMLSARFDLTILLPSPLHLKNKIFFGTIVVDKGRLLGISDSTHPLSDEYTPSNSLKVFDTSIGRLGVVSGDDIKFFEVSRLMCLWECDLLIFAIDKKVDRKSKILAEAQGYTNETTTLLFGKDRAQAFNYSSLKRESKEVLLIDLKKDRKLIHKRRRELYRDLIIR